MQILNEEGRSAGVPLPSDIWPPVLWRDIQFSRIPGCEKQKPFDGTHATIYLISTPTDAHI